MVPIGLHIGSSTPWRHPLRMCHLWFLLAYLQGYVSTLTVLTLHMTSQRDCSEVFMNRTINHEATLVMGVITNLLILISVLSAFPWLRNNFHNVFERHHRFIGWYIDLLSLSLIMKLIRWSQVGNPVHLGICAYIFFSPRSLPHDSECLDC